MQKKELHLKLFLILNSVSTNYAFVSAGTLG
jgi:hypothetical protein